MAVLNVKAGLVESAETASERGHSRDCGGLNAGQATHALENFGLGGNGYFVVLVFFAGEQEIRFVQIMCGDTWIDVPRANEAFQQEARRDGENKCEANL